MQQAPQRAQEVAPKKRRRSKKAVFGWLLLVLFLSLGGGAGGFMWQKRLPRSQQHQAGTNMGSDMPAATLGAVSENGELPAENETPKTTPKTISSQEFHQLYETSAYPNTKELTTAPVITGNTPADTHIQQLAESRGFRLRSIPMSPIERLGTTVLDEPFLLQEKAYSGWEQLRKAANTAGVNLTVTSGFRSIEDQRQLFLDRLNNLAVKIDKISDGSQDALLVQALQLVAPPGYSRHHTGYTVDFSCDAQGSFTFIDSSCYRWLTADNFKQAKAAGWVPSYPDGVEKQGPEPEPWEFVWIGTNGLFQ